MAVSKLTGLLLVVAVAAAQSCVVSMKLGPACRWAVLGAEAKRLPVDEADSARELYRAFLVTFADELCRSPLRLAHLPMTTDRIGLGGSITYVRVDHPSGGSSLNFLLAWNQEPTEADFRQKAREIIAVIVIWLQQRERCPSPLPGMQVAQFVG